MDAKNDDSAGSDSLDKSLQKKCVVDDVGQGDEGSTPTGNAAALAQGINNRNDKQSKSDSEEADNRPAISINTLQQQHQLSKTEKSAGDGICDGKSGSGIVVDNNYQNDDVNMMNSLDILTANDTNKAQMLVANATMTATTTNNANVNNNAECGVDENLCRLSSNDSSTNISNNIVNNAAEASSDCGLNTTNNSENSNCNNSNAFETKVKQISKNLKETTLAECTNAKATTITEDTNSTSSASTASSASSTPECEQAAAATIEDATTAALYSLGPSTSAAAAAAAAAATAGGGTTAAQDEHDNRAKKVRFHPDVKENDGGNRVIPKKKRKLKGAQGGAGASSGASGGGSGDEASGGSQRGATAEDDMELDEEDDSEEEGIFSIAKTIEDAQDYLKEHPLTFAGSFDKSNVTTQSGLLEEEDLPQLCEIVEDDEEDMHAEVVPENGVACILGKQIKCGKVEFLLRYVDRPGLYWETEEFISQRCPNLLNQYEQCRERRQARLMNFVAKRQNLRQRYTDF